MMDWLDSEFCFYFNELHRSMDEAIEEYGSVLTNNLHNKEFDAEKAQKNIFLKYFPELKEATHYSLN